MSFNRILLPVTIYLLGVSISAAYIPPPPVDIPKNQNKYQSAEDLFTKEVSQNWLLDKEFTGAIKINPNSTTGSTPIIDLNGHKITVDSGGIEVKFTNPSRIIGKGTLTSNTGFINIKLNRKSITNIDGLKIHSIIADSQHKVGLKITGNGKTNGVIIKGSESNTYTGDTIISGPGAFGATAIQGNVSAENGGILRFDGSDQLSSKSVVTLKNGSINFLGNINTDLTNRIHQLKVEENSTINFGREPGNPSSDKQLIYINDLIISNRGFLRVNLWEEGKYYLLVRKNSAHLKDALKKMSFTGYDRNAIHLEDYNTDYYSISPTPEPATCGALLATYQKRRRCCR